MEIKLNNFSTIGEKKQEQEHVKMLVIGSGPAGLAAALYGARAELSPVVLSGMQIGGQAAITHVIENYPGFPDGVGGSELTELFQKNAEKFGARVEFDSATSVDLSQRPFVVKTYNKEYLADTLIVSTGASPNHLNIPGETELTGKGVSYCGTCDGWFFKDKRVVVVGGGDSALEEGLFLTRFASDLKIIHRRDELRAGAILQKRAQENEKLSFVWNSVVEEIVGDGAVKKVRIKNTKTGEESFIETDGVFIFIGHTPNAELFRDQLEFTDNGYIKVDSKMHTSVPGVYAAGEIADSHFRQVITSAGMGAAAGIEATHFLEANE
jgi:thioredoxin reductase (NADPH)